MKTFSKIKRMCHQSINNLSIFNTKMHLDHIFDFMLQNIPFPASSVTGHGGHWSDEELGDRDDHWDILLLSANYQAAGHLGRHLTICSGEKSNKWHNDILVLSN